MSSGELAHYGVKGMKWGVRRAESNARNANYSTRDRDKDQMRVGKRGVKKINRRMNKGETHQVARSKVIRNKAMRKLAIAGAIYYSPQILNGIDMTKGSIAQRAQTKRGESFVRNTFADTKGIGAGKYKNKPKPNRDGVYNISSM